MSKVYPEIEDAVSEKHERLGELLRQTLALAGEIAEDKGRHLPGECIILRRRSNSDPAGAHHPGPHRQSIRRSLLERRKALNLNDSEDSLSPSPSPSHASSVQEPFSPGSVAVSLDAVVEKGTTSDEDLCILDNASATSVTPCFVEQPSNTSSLFSTEEGQHGLTAQTWLTQPTSNENAIKRLQRPSLFQRNTSMIVHNGQELLVEAPTGILLPQQITQRSSAEPLGRRKTPAQESPLGLPARSRTSKSQGNSGNALEKSQKSEEEGEGDIIAHDQPSPPKWHARILPIAPSRDLGSAASSPPAFVKLEAVFPLKASAEGNAMPSLSFNGESSYFIIGQLPTDSLPKSPRPQAGGEGSSVDHEKNLQEFIDEWEYDAEAPVVEDKKF